MRTAITYSRVSTGRQVKGQSIEQQSRSIKLYCQLHDLHVAKNYIEEAKSAREMSNRPKLAAALDLVCERQGTLVVWKLDRLIRSAADCESICDRLTKAGAALASVTESIDTSTAMGKAFLGITAVFARLESDRIGERVKAANDLTEDKLGYRTQGSQKTGVKVENGRRVASPGEVGIIGTVDILARYGLSDAGIATELNRLGVPTISQLRKHKRPAARWTRGLVSNLLKSDVPSPA